LSFFLKVNPGMRFSGLFQYSKYDILNKLKPAYRPKTKYYEALPSEPEFYKQEFDFPFICKPDFGQMGKGVSLIQDETDWMKKVYTLNHPFILQEYIDYTTEFGILYYRFPNGGSNIVSVASKDFLSVVGNGTQTLGELVTQHLRAATRIEFLQEKFWKTWNEILPKGEEVLLEEIGNHCRGTTFYNANHLINEQLVKVFDEIVQSVDGFYYGRFDLRVKSLEDLYKGQNIKIVEINGVTSEAGHIYDPNYSLLQTYRDVSNNLKIVYQIYQQLKGKTESISYRELIQAAKKQFFTASKVAI